jgi:hypothetical protein
MNEAATLLAPATPFLELTGAGILGMAALTFFAVSTVELERHAASRYSKQLARYCTLKNVFGGKLLILFWR